jgi:predicted GNAT superfamily acetyltransferase
MVDRARQDAARAAGTAGVRVRTLHELREQDEARAIWDAAWPTVPGATEVTGNLLRAIEHCGGYVAGAFDGPVMVGACLAIIGRSEDAPGGWRTHLHSHMAATLPGCADRGIGTAMKVHQRAWALDRGIDRITWTFDPLVRRNARVNLSKLGGVGVEYLVDFYGALEDERNAGDESDRLLLQWDVAADSVAAALAGRPSARSAQQWLAGGAQRLLRDHADGPELQPTTAGLVLVDLPDDIVVLRRTDPAMARRWRRQVRAAMEPVLAGGGRVVALTADGSYVMEVAR